MKMILMGRTEQFARKLFESDPNFTLSTVPDEDAIIKEVKDINYFLFVSKTQSVQEHEQS